MVYYGSLDEKGKGKVEPVESVLDYGRYFSFDGKSPYEFDIYGNRINWIKEDVRITDDSGKTIFIQPNVSRPDFWSSLAIKVVAGKYFWGNQDKGERENSVEMLIGRVSRFFERQAVRQGYFDNVKAGVLREEIAAICLNQLGVFNSPVWFNAGIQDYDKEAGGVGGYRWDLTSGKVVSTLKSNDAPQCSACFIQSVEDNMESIMALQFSEAMLFKAGSGTGTNRSSLRSSKERLTGGGRASGPVSFMKGYDAYAGIIKSGGKTRRAAKMEILNIDHPDIIEFIESKQKEEKKAWALIEMGYSGGMNGDAYSSIAFQNCNMSVRAQDAFMEAVKKDDIWETKAVKGGQVIEKLKAKEVLKKIAEGTWLCGDPGMQFDTIFNRYNTCKSSGRINATNPCSEYGFLDDSACNLASINLMKFLNGDSKFDSEKFRKTVKTFIIAQELAVDGSSYPTDKITKNSHDFRPLGLGYANLGAMLMSLGLPYDSDSGRAVAAAITAIMGGEAYKVSAQLASLVGPFPRYKENKDSMLDVIKLHRENVKKIQVEKIPEQLRYLVNDAWDAWTEALELGEKYGYRNAQVTVLAPTGCLIGNSLISTDEGLVRLTSLGNKKGEQWQNVSFKIMTDQGPKDATKFYVNGQASTRKIKTSCGYEIQGTEKHRIKVLDTTNNKLIWKRFDEVNEEDIIPLAVNTIFGDEKEVLLPLKPELHWNADFELKTPEKMNKELAEIIGYFMGDGSFHSKGLRFCVDNKDLDVVEKLSNLIKNVFNLEVSITPQKGYKEVAVNSVPLTFWWEACGFSKIKPSENHKGKGYTPHIPDAILHTNDRKIYTSFLKGLFEADGTISSGVPAMSTASNEFAKEIRTLLLALGYPTTTKIDKSGWGESDLYVLRLKNISYNKNFVDNIGFISNRKVNGINLSKSSQSGKNDRVYISEEIIDETVPIGSKYRNSALLSMKRNHAISRDMAIQIYQDTKHPQLLWALQFFYDGVESNSDGGIQSTYDLSVPENVTYTANGFISHNTIAFLMDCDTTGIEPDIALVKYKVLAGGGMLKIVNRSVSLALKNLGYNENQIREIIEYVDKNDTIEGSSVKDEHLSIFDCAFKAAKGKRSIQYSGHINMMSGVQPFLSGAISKTINMPENSTVEDIMDAYVMSWEKGLKAVGIYRENSKRAQPLNTKKTDGEMVKREEVIKEVVVLGQRKKLPQTRRSLTHKFDIAGHEGYVMIGLYDDGKPGELFVTMHKEGSTIRGLMDAWATSVSLNLQYGASVNDLFDKFRYQKFEPSGFVRNPGGGDMSDKIKQIRTASSIVDYVAQFMLNNFGEGSGTMKVEIKTLEPEVETQLSIKDFHKEEESDEKASQKVSPEGLTCPHCGGPAKRLGNCAIFCTSCKQTTRSGCGE